ncbi:MAG TPA: caspase family protein [Actinoplanes sp.]|nr:caspase family protein [Actinoplanes sp.]
MAGRRSALIVANDRYDNEGLSRLRSPVADATELARVLGDPRIGGFQVATVQNEPAHVISSRIEDFFTDSRPDDVLLVHFSCHGLKSESGELYFAASATRPDRLGSTAVSADFVQRCMRSSRSRSVVLLLDCCYGGAFGRGVTVRAAGDVGVLETFRGGGRGRAVITASSAMEYAFEGDRLADDHHPAPSVFTAALVQGLETGDADRDEDGWVSLNELYDYVYDRVRERNANQTPGRAVEMQGELYLARSGRQRLKPVPIPANLRAALTDHNVFTRMGAVTELRSRLSGTDTAVAAGALEALREVAASDIAYVADVARAAMDDVRTTAATTSVELGAAPVTIALTGPPLSRVCTVETSQPWLRAESTTDGVTLTAEPAGSERSASVEVTGPVSAATIAVRQTVRATPATRAKARARQDRRRSLDPRTGPIVALSAGLLAVLLGVAIFAVESTDTKVRLAEAHLGLFAAYWVWQAIERRGLGRVVPVLLVLWTATTLTWMIAVDWYYMEEYALDGTPLRTFWVITGLLVAAAAIGRPDPVPDLLAGALAVAYGLVVIGITRGSEDTAFSISWAYFVIVIGLVWLAGGLEGLRRLPDRAGQHG